MPRPCAFTCSDPSRPWSANRSSGGSPAWAKRSAAKPGWWSRSGRCGNRPCLRLGAGAMGELTPTEQLAIERAAAEPMLEQVEAWAAVNSGSRNLDGLADMAYLLSDAFAALPGELAFEDPEPVEAADAAGPAGVLEHGKNQPDTPRSHAPGPIVFTA